MKAGMSIKGDRGMTKRLAKLGVSAHEVEEEIVQATMLDAQRTIVQSIQKGPASGRVYEKYTPRRTHQASAPGQAPMTDTGTLASSIQHRLDGLTGHVFSRLQYALYLEFGTQNMAARPYFNPAIEQVRPRFIKRHDRLIERAMRGVT